MVNNVNASRNTTIQRLNISEEKMAYVKKNHLGRGNSNKPAPVSAQAADTVSFSLESLSMLNAQQATQQTTFDLSTRERPTSLITEREFTIFSRNVLTPHMPDADIHLGRMKRAILDPSRATGTDLTLAERTMMRESILQEAQRLADTYLEGEDAQRFVDGFANLIREAEMVEKGYVRVSDNPWITLSDDATFRRPHSISDQNTLLAFLGDVMTDEQRAQLTSLESERDRLTEKLQDLARDANGNMTGGAWDALRTEHPELWEAFEQATMAVRNFIAEMGEYHGFQEQWDVWQAGNAPADNWFVQAEAAFELNSAQITEQIEEIRLNFHQQFQLNGFNPLRDLLAGLRLQDADNPFLSWLTQLQGFNTGA